MAWEKKGEDGGQTGEMNYGHMKKKKIKNNVWLLLYAFNDDDANKTVHRLSRSNEKKKQRKKETPKKRNKETTKKRKNAKKSLKKQVNKKKENAKNKTHKKRERKQHKNVNRRADNNADVRLHRLGSCAVELVRARRCRCEFYLQECYPTFIFYP